MWQADERDCGELEWAGRAFRSRLEPLRSVEGEIVGVAGIAVDVSGERQAAAALRETEDRFRSAFEDAAIGMAIVAPDVVLYMSGYADDQVIGRRELEADALLLEKPFTRELLGRKVREALAAGPGRRSAG